MGKPLKNIVYTIKEELSGYIISDDNLFTDNYLIDKINGVREVLIAEQFREGGIDSQFYQSLCCLEVKCHNQGCTLNGKFYKSGSTYFYVELPSLITKVGMKNIIYFGLDDFYTEFTRMSFDGYMSSDGALWTNKKPLYTVIDGKAIMKNLPTPGLKYICINALLSNPISSCNYDDNEDYPVPDVYKLELLVKKDIMSMYGIVGDEINDARDIKGIIKQSQNKQKDE